MTNPPTPAPATEAPWNMIVMRLIAFGRCSRGTSVAVSDWRAGASNVPNAADSAAREDTGHRPLQSRLVLYGGCRGRRGPAGPPVGGEPRAARARKPAQPPPTAPPVSTPAT